MSAALGVLAAFGVDEPNLTKGWWLALIVGLIVSAPTALTGLADWLTISWRTPLWWTATRHMLSMLAATACFALAAVFGHDRYIAGDMGSRTLAATLVGFGLLSLGSWLGGTIVFVHGMRVKEREQ